MFKWVLRWEHHWHFQGKPWVFSSKTRFDYQGMDSSNLKIDGIGKAESTSKTWTLISGPYLFSMDPYTRVVGVHLEGENRTSIVFLPLLGPPKMWSHSVRTWMGQGKRVPKVNISNISSLYAMSWLQTIYITGWWFGIFFIFAYIGNNDPNWRTHIFQRGGEKTTN